MCVQALPRREGHDREDQEEREDKVLVVYLGASTRAFNEPSRRFQLGGGFNNLC